MISESSMNVESSTYANAATLYAGSKPEHWDSGVVAYNTLPAADWNWMWNYVTSNLKDGAEDIASIVEDTVELAKGIGYTDLDSVTLTNVIEAYVERLATTDTPGAILSSEAPGHLIVKEDGTATIVDWEELTTNVETLVKNTTSLKESTETLATNTETLTTNTESLKENTETLSTNTSSLEDQYGKLTSLSETLSTSNLSLEERLTALESKLDLALHAREVDVSTGPFYFYEDYYIANGTQYDYPDNHAFYFTGEVTIGEIEELTTQWSTSWNTFTSNGPYFVLYENAIVNCCFDCTITDGGEFGVSFPRTRGLIDIEGGTLNIFGPNSHQLYYRRLDQSTTYYMSRFLRSNYVNDIVTTTTDDDGNVTYSYDITDIDALPESNFNIYGGTICVFASACPVSTYIKTNINCYDGRFVFVQPRTVNIEADGGFLFSGIGSLCTFNYYGGIFIGQVTSNLQSSRQCFMGMSSSACYSINGGITINLYGGSVYCTSSGYSTFAYLFGCGTGILPSKLNTIKDSTVNIYDGFNFYGLAVNNPTGTTVARSSVLEFSAFPQVTINLNGGNFCVVSRGIVQNSTYIGALASVASFVYAGLDTTQTDDPLYNQDYSTVELPTVNINGGTYRITNQCWDDDTPTSTTTASSKTMCCSILCRHVDHTASSYSWAQSLDWTGKFNLNGGLFLMAYTSGYSSGGIGLSTYFNTSSTTWTSATADALGAVTVSTESSYLYIFTSQTRVPLPPLFMLQRWTVACSDASLPIKGCNYIPRGVFITLPSSSDLTFEDTTLICEAPSEVIVPSTTTTNIETVKYICAPEKYEVE